MLRLDLCDFSIIKYLLISSREIGNKLTDDLVRLAERRHTDMVFKLTYLS